MPAKTTLQLEPKSSARNVGELLAILQHDFGNDIVAGFETFDRLVHEYDRRTPGDPLQDQVKIGTVLRNFVDVPLKQHLPMSLQHLDTYTKLRNEVVRARHARLAAAAAPQPMDTSGTLYGEGHLDALGKGKGGGRGRGGGKGGGGRGAGSQIATTAAKLATSLLTVRNAFGT